MEHASSAGRLAASRPRCDHPRTKLSASVRRSIPPHPLQPGGHQGRCLYAKAVAQPSNSGRRARALPAVVLPGYTSGMKTAISLPDDIFRRVDDAAKRMGVSRSEFFARAAERWLDALQEDDTTAAINRAISGLDSDHAFVDAAAAALVTRELY